MRKLSSLRGSSKSSGYGVTTHGAAANPKRARRCPNPHCSNPDIQESEGQTICFNCGTVVSDSVIVNEITYGEAASGAAIVQGTQVQDGARTAKSTSTGFRRGPRTKEESAQSAVKEGRDEIDRLANALKISTSECARAEQLYTLARLHHFGRPKRENAAICLYIACRQSKSNAIMLIDFADQLRVNVFELGATYKQFLKAIGMEDEIEELPQLEIEPLLLKYAKRLEFGSAQAGHKVANDAALVVSRMDRDWMKTGRQPAALIGASLILAARMNNYHRTVREVVYVVKAGEITINKRLEEFRRTRAGRMSVQQFRELGSRLKGEHEPPAIYQAKEKAAKKRKLDEAAHEGEGDETLTMPASKKSRQDTATSEAAPEVRRDKDGFVIPELPTSRTPLEAGTPSPDGETDDNGTVNVGDRDDLTRNGDQPNKKRKRKSRKKEEPEIFVPTADDLEDPELEGAIQHIVQDHSHEEQYEASLVRAKAIAEYERKRVEQQHGRPQVSDDTVLDEHEFDDDPEVANCVLSEREVAVKELIWTNRNWDWLKQHEQRLLQAELDIIQGKRKKKNTDDKPSKRPRRGDGSILEGHNPSSPAEATMIMLTKRARKSTFSKHLNYEKLQSIYSMSGKSSTTASSSSSRSNSEASSRDSSLAPSVASSPRASKRNQPKRKQKTGLPTPSGTQSLEPAASTASGSKNRPLEVPDDADSASEVEDEMDLDRPHFRENYDDEEDDDEVDEQARNEDEADFDEELVFG